MHLHKKQYFEKGRFTAVLTGDLRLQESIDSWLLTNTKNKIDWNNVVFIFWGDERWVPLEDDLSNAKMSYNTTFKSCAYS
ncbi:6-phosphogluconolactonase [Flavobacterium branchiarum]|uniref:6-phosphogluconolactonase n=1 Tax=Flavobacterium branchiarum TaxID=1114870 RepID=UPI00338E874B